MKRGWTVLGVAGILICLVSCHKTAIEQEGGAPSPESGGIVNTTPYEEELAGIKTAVARIEPMAEQVRLTGEISPVETGKADITSPLAGIISLNSPFVHLGARVRKGDHLAVINSIYGQTPVQVVQKLELDRTALAQSRDSATQAQAELGNAASDLRRKKELFEGGVASKSDLLDARERFAKAKSAAQAAGVFLSVARAALRRDQSVFHQTRLTGSAFLRNLTPVPLEPGRRGFPPAASAGAVSFYITAPISGTVTHLSISSGLWVSPGNVLATVVNTDRLYVDANAYESDLPLIHIGDLVKVTVPGFRREEFEGKVKYVGEQIDSAARTALVRSQIENRDGTLRPGMFVSVTLSPKKVRNMLAVPENAVIIHADNRYVFVETKPGRYEKRSVKAGLTTQEKVEILSGLKEGDRIVTDGNLLLEAQE